MHVDMTKRLVAETLPKLTALAQSLHALPIKEETVPAEAPAFRYLTRRLLVSITPLCQMVAGASNEEVMRAASDTVARLKKDVAATQFSAQFAIAEADVAFDLSNTVVECAEPAKASPQQVSNEAAAEAGRQIAAIKTIAMGLQGQGPRPPSSADLE